MLTGASPTRAYSNFNRAGLLERERTVHELAVPLQLHHDRVANLQLLEERAQLAEPADLHAIDSVDDVAGRKATVARVDSACRRGCHDDASRDPHGWQHLTDFICEIQPEDAEARNHVLAWVHYVRQARRVRAFTDGDRKLVRSPIAQNLEGGHITHDMSVHTE